MNLRNDKCWGRKRRVAGKKMCTAAALACAKASPTRPSTVGSHYYRGDMRGWLIAPVPRYTMYKIHLSRSNANDKAGLRLTRVLLPLPGVVREHGLAPAAVVLVLLLVLLVPG